MQWARVDEKQLGGVVMGYGAGEWLMLRLGCRELQRREIGRLTGRVGWFLGSASASKLPKPFRALRVWIRHDILNWTAS